MRYANRRVAPANSPRRIPNSAISAFGYVLLRKNSAPATGSGMRNPYPLLLFVFPGIGNKGPRGKKKVAPYAKKIEKVSQYQYDTKKYDGVNDIHPPSTRIRREPAIRLSLILLEIMGLQLPKRI